MSRAFVVGYDPGGNDAHGVAVLEVREASGVWEALALESSTVGTLRDVVSWLEERCSRGRIVAAGIDTLTEWNTGEGGWRSADRWLRERYPAVARSVIAPNSISGSMTLNGAAFLTLLAPRFRTDGTMVTESHPKVCFFALAGAKHDWAGMGPAMSLWLLRELGIDLPAGDLGAGDHCFDAEVSALAALSGLRGDWRLDLHALPNAVADGRVQFCGPTHFWWPSPGGGGVTKTGLFL